MDLQAKAPWPADWHAEHLCGNKHWVIWQPEVRLYAKQMPELRGVVRDPPNPEAPA